MLRFNQPCGTEMDRSTSHNRARAESGHCKLQGTIQWWLLAGWLHDEQPFSTSTFADDWGGK